MTEQQLEIYRKALICEIDSWRRFLIDNGTAKQLDDFNHKVATWDGLKNPIPDEVNGSGYIFIILLVFIPWCYGLWQILKTLIEYFG